MQIKYQGNATFELVSKEAKVILSENISINDFTFPGPGEYEKAKVILSGIKANGNTIYLLNIEDIKVCYLNRLGHALTEDELKEIGDVDILFLPLGEENTIDLKIALKMISHIDPNMVIPMLYNDLTEFKKSEGLTEEDVTVLKIKKQDFLEGERRVVVFKES